MGERNDFMDKQDEVMLPGFRFHPTDEELVAFYLKRKIQQKPLTIELIRQLDIYKFDPWDLPKLAASGEKEWYFYCPRDRKYRNSTRPNRVTGAGFWKATGTDRPIYSSEGTKCIGLKKSLVFYKGRAAKGIKTDWMMHEFRLPPLTDSSLQKRPTDKTIPANDAWAICRIFKKTNSMAQKALYQSWVPPLLENNNETDMFSISQSANVTHFGSENMSSTSSEAGSIQFGCSNGMQQQGITLSYTPLDVTSYKPITMINYKPSLLPITNEDIPTNFMFSPAELSVPSKCSADLEAMLLNLSPTILGDEEKVPATIDFGQPNQCNIPAINLAMDMSGHCGSGQEDLSVRKTEDIGIFNNQWGNTRTVNFPFDISSSLSDDWKPALPWDSPPCPSDMSTSYSTNKPFT